MTTITIKIGMTMMGECNDGGGLLLKTVCHVRNAVPIIIDASSSAPMALNSLLISHWLF